MSHANDNLGVNELKCYDDQCRLSIIIHMLL